MRSILRLVSACAILTVILLASCGSDRTARLPESSQPVGQLQPAMEFPSGLPVDGLQPWEETRAGSALDAQSEFTLGTQRFLEGGSVLDAGAASRIGDSSGAGDGMSFALYRLPMAGQQPGALAFDVNILPDGDFGPSSYYIGLSNYAAGRWEWHGPYSEHHVRLVRSSQPGPDVFASEDYTSEFDNLFVNVLVHGSSQVDVLGISSDSLSGADAEAPPVPQGLAATGINGGVALTWNPVLAADLAGYRVNFSKQAFSAPDEAGVQHAGFVEGNTRHLLAGLSGEVHVRISAVDNNGNESMLSDEVTATALSGDAPLIRLEVSNNSVPRNAVATVEVVGGDENLLYDYDLDGDGIFELTGETDTLKALPTQDTGLIRPAVRASDLDGERIALGGVSLLISSNSRPVADALASVQFGTAPLSVDFDGSGSTDFDGTVVGGGWDFDGDGVYDSYDEGSTANLSASHQYNTPGFYNARLKVLDDEGAWDVDTIGIFVDGGETQNRPPVANLVFSPDFIISGLYVSPIDMQFDASSSFDPDFDTLEYAWDVNGDGSYASYQSLSTASISSFTQGLHRAGVRVRDEAGNISQATVVYAVYQFNSQLVDSGRTVGNATSIVSVDSILGSTRTGIAYYDSSNDDLMFTYCTDQNGYSWQPAYVVEALGGEWMSLVPNASDFQMGYYRDGNLYYRESDDEGKSFEAPIDVDTGADDAGMYVDAVRLTNKPAFAYYNATDGDLYYAVSNSVNVSNFGTPVNVDGTGDTGLYPDVVYSGGNHSIAYYRQDNGNLMFVQSTDTSGLNWGSPVMVDGNDGDVGRHPSMLSISFKFCIAYLDSLNDVWFVKSSDSSGSAWGTPLHLGNVNAKTCEMMVVGDRLAIFIGDDVLGRGEFILSEDISGDSWGSWEYFDYGDTTGFMSAAPMFNGMPGLAYWDEDQELYFTTPRLD